MVPRVTVRSTRRMAWMAPFGTGKSTERARISSRAIASPSCTVAQRVPKDRKGQRQNKDRYARCGRIPPAFWKELAPCIDHLAPVCDGRRDPQSKEGQRRGRQQSRSHIQRGLNRDRPDGGGQDVAQDDA